MPVDRPGDGFAQRQFVHRRQLTLPPPGSIRRPLPAARRPSAARPSFPPNAIPAFRPGIWRSVFAVVDFVALARDAVVEPVSAVELVDLVVVAADDDVVAVAADEHVPARAPGHGVVPGVAAHDVVARPAVEVVVAAVASDRVVAGAAADRVVAALAADDVVSALAVDGVVAVA